MQGKGLFVEQLPDGGRRVFEALGIDCDSKNKQATPYGSHSLTIRKNGNSYQFKDWSLDIGGDCVNFVETARGMSRSGAIAYIRQMYGITSTDSPNAKPSRTPVSASKWLTPQPVSRTSSKTSIDIASEVLTDLQLREFSESELRYWNSKTAGLVTPELLSKYNIRAIESNTSSKSGAIRKHNNLSHYFAFESLIEGYYKVLTPKRVSSKGERLKSLYLTTREAHLHRATRPTFRYSFATEHLQSGVAYLCEGEADTLCLIAAGYQAFTFGGVTPLLRDAERAELAHRGITRVVVVFDSDEAGRKATDKVCSRGYHEFAVVPFVLPKLTGAKDCKDVCDYLALYGFDADLRKGLEKASTDLIPTSGKISRRGVTVDTTDFHISKYIDNATSGAICSVLQHYKRVLLAAPTGSGKTTTAITIAQQISSSSNRVVIALPNIAAVAQLAKQYQLPCISSQTGLDEMALLQAAGEPVVITTYDSLKHCGHIGTLIVDEVHQLAGDRTYRASAVQSVFKAMQTAQLVLAMTATPETLLCAEFGFHTVRCLSSDRQTLRAELRAIHKPAETQIPTAVGISKTDKRIATAVAWATDRVHAGRVAVIRFKSKKAIAKIKLALASSGISGVYSITSDEKTKGDCAIYQCIESGGVLPDDCNVLLCTNCIDTSVNIRGSLFDVAIFDELSTDNIVQFAARFRDMEQIRIALFYGELTQLDSAKISADLLYTQHTKAAQSLCDHFNALSEIIPNYHYELEKTSSSYLYWDSTMRDSHTGKYSVSVDWCYSQAIRDAGEKTSDDVAQVLSDMNKQGIACVQFVQHEELTEQPIEPVLKASAKVDAENQFLQAELLTELKTNEHEFLVAFYRYTSSKAIKGQILSHIGAARLCGTPDSSIEEYTDTKKQLLSYIDAEKVVHGYLQDIAEGFTRADALHLAQALQGSNSRTSFKRHLTDLQRLENPPQKLSGQLKAELLALLSIVGAFTVGERVSGKEIRRRIAETSGAYKIAPKNAVSLFRALFGATRSGKAKEYTVGTLTTVAKYCASYGVSAPSKRVFASTSSHEGDTSPLINAFTDPDVSHTGGLSGVSPSRDIDPRLLAHPSTTHNTTQDEPVAEPVW